MEPSTEMREVFRPQGAQVLTPEEAAARIGELRPGESLCWYCGYLPTDRLYPRRPEGDVATWRWRFAREKAVDRLAQFMLRQGAPRAFAYNADRGALRVAGEGRGHLWQKRLGPMSYEYHFTRGAA